jgi:hypothetical protein
MHSCSVSLSRHKSKGGKRSQDAHPIRAEVDGWVPIVHRIQWGVMDMPVTGARPTHTAFIHIQAPFMHCLPSDQAVSSMKKGKTIYSSSCQCCKSFFILYIDPDSAL